MPLNPDAVGTTSEPIEVSWDSKDALLYAVGVGAGTEELAFVTENTADTPQRVLPTFPVIVGWGAAHSPVASAGEINWAMVVHGTQSVTLHREIPPAGKATLTSKLVAMWDKGKAAVLVTETNAVADDGRPLYTTGSSIFVRDGGGFGGERGPSGPQHVPPDRAPDFEVSDETLPTQALIYRLSGDRNPLHSDPSFAALAGFDRPILHGLCTYGFTGRALLHTVCGSDPSRFEHIEGRFTSPVMPGDTLTTRVWTTTDGEAVYTTSVGDRVVIDQGRFRYS